jgi:predicted nucleic acid-binding Zn ribbon protein
MAQYYKFDKDKAYRKPGVTPLKEAIEQMFNSSHMKKGYDESYLTAHWEKIMGHTIASRTQKVYVRDRVLFLQIESAPLRSELVHAKNKIIELINREMKTSLINEVVFL